VDGGPGWSARPPRRVYLRFEVLNVLSAQSWFAYPGSNGYHASKAAQWALTNGVRLELAEQGTSSPACTSALSTPTSAPLTTVPRAIPPTPYAPGSTGRVD
jgi:NAD(P)-dependent dehydrogenase (short-subunit alcohol dehydrogenase family)